MSFTNTPTGPASNHGAAHDTGLYDPAVHDNQIVALYETDAQALSAKDALTAAGVPASAIQLIARGSDTGTLGGVNAEDGEHGMWGAIKSLFVPDDDRTAYTHAIGRGHAMLIVTPGAGVDRAHIIHTLEGTNPVDFDARLAEWRQAGYDSSAPHQDYTASTGLIGAATGMGMSGTAALATSAPVATGYATEIAHPTTPAAGVSGDDTIKVVEESLRVGKREVAAGAVRIRSYVVERPIEEQVRLREERIEVDRRPVDRPATTADFGAAFQERTIEARATSEEAVVSKEARVVEEIGLRKEASERTETIHDTVRKTEVEIDGDTTGAPGTVPGSKVGTTAGGTSPVATPGAGTSGANAPRQ